MQTMIFDINLSGHHLEYIHHIHVGAVRKKKKNFYFTFLWIFKRKRNYIIGNLPIT